MTKTSANIAAGQDAKSGEPAMMPIGAMADGSFVWIFEFGSLGFGIWCLEFSWLPLIG